MLTPFQELPGHARVWIYQADRMLTTQECEMIESEAATFIESWDAHGAALQASFGMAYQRFFILAVNENYNLPSGCSIDKSVALVKKFEQQFNVDFFNRTHIPFYIEDTIKVFPMSELKVLVQEGVITSETLVFDNTVDTKGKLDKQWRVEAGKTWLKRFFKQRDAQKVG